MEDDITVVSVKDIEIFNCGFKNCHSSFSSEFLTTEHVRMKHERQKKLIAIAKSSDDGFIQGSLEREKRLWLSNCNQKSCNLSNTEIQRKNLPVFQSSAKKDQKLCCLKCHTIIPSNWDSKQRHIIGHLKYEINCKDFFQCLLCPTNDTYVSIHQQAVAYHLRCKHCVKDHSVRKYYLDNRNKYFDVMQSMAVACFGEKFYKKSFHTKRILSSTDKTFAEIVQDTTVKISNEKYQENLLNDTAIVETEPNIKLLEAQVIQVEGGMVKNKKFNAASKGELLHECIEMIRDFNKKKLNWRPTSNSVNFAINMESDCAKSNPDSLLVHKSLIDDGDDYEEEY